MERFNPIKRVKRRILLAALYAAGSLLVNPPPPIYAQSAPAEQTPHPSPALEFNSPFPPAVQELSQNHRQIPVFRPMDPVNFIPRPWTREATVTAYCLKGETKSKTHVREGVVATDPNFIPTGSMLDIEDLGQDYIAEDTGSGVKGWHIDVWNPSCLWAKNWGRQFKNFRITRLGWK